MPSEERFMAFRMFMSRSARGADDFLEELLAEFDLAVPQPEGSPGVSSFHQNPVRLATGELTLAETCLSS